MQMSELMVSSPHNFLFILFTEMMKIPYFQLRESKTCLISSLNKCRIMFTPIYFYMRTCFSVFEPNIFFIIWYTKYMDNCEAMTSSTQSFAYIDCSRNVLLKIKKIQNFISSLFLSDLHQIFTVLLIFFFYYFYWINLNLDQIFPLKTTNLCFISRKVEKSISDSVKADIINIIGILGKLL